MKRLTKTQRMAITWALGRKAPSWEVLRAVVEVLDSQAATVRDLKARLLHAKVMVSIWVADPEARETAGRIFDLKLKSWRKGGK